MRFLSRSVILAAAVLVGHTAQAQNSDPSAAQKTARASLEIRADGPFIKAETIKSRLAKEIGWMTQSAKSAGVDKVILNVKTSDHTYPALFGKTSVQMEVYAEGYPFNLTISSFELSENEAVEFTRKGIINITQGFTDYERDREEKAKKGIFMIK